MITSDPQLTRYRNKRLLRCGETAGNSPMKLTNRMIAFGLIVAARLWR